MLAVMKKLKYDDEYNFENEVNRHAVKILAFSIDYNVNH